MRYLLFCLLFFGYGVHAQTLNKTDSNRVKPGDTLVIDSGFKDSLKIFKPTIYDYTYQTQFPRKKSLIRFLQKIKPLSSRNITTAIISGEFSLQILVQAFSSWCMR